MQANTRCDKPGLSLERRSGENTASGAMKRWAPKASVLPSGSWKRCRWQVVSFASCSTTALIAR